MTVKKRKRNKEEQRVVHQDRSKFLLTTDKYDILKSWRLRSDKARRWNVAEIQESFCISLIDEPTLVQAIVPDKFIREFPHHQDYFHDIFHCVTCTTRIPVLKLDDGGRTVKFEQLDFPFPVSQLLYIAELRTYVAVDMDWDIVLLVSMRDTVKELHRGQPMYSAQSVCTFRKEYVITGSIRGVIKFNELKLTDDTIVQLGFLRDRGTPTFFIRQPFKITVYELYDMYQMFVMTESTAIDYIQRLNGLEEHPDRLMIATSDGGMRLHNPVTAATVGAMYPITTLELSHSYVYNPYRRRLYMTISGGEVQAHHGDVTCLEPLVEADEKRERVYRTSSLLVSCGSEMCVRLWKIRCHPDEIDGLELRLHPIVQVWSSDNELLRELVFFDPVISACFATDFGDLFFAKDVVPVDKYLPWELLKTMLDKNFARRCHSEIPRVKVQFLLWVFDTLYEHTAEALSWIDPKRVPRRRIPRYTSQYLTRQAIFSGSMMEAEWQINWVGSSGLKHTMNVPVTFRPPKGPPKRRFAPTKKVSMVIPQDAIARTTSYAPADAAAAEESPTESLAEDEDYDEEPEEPELRALRFALQAGGMELLSETYGRIQAMMRGPSRRAGGKTYEADETRADKTKAGQPTEGESRADRVSMEAEAAKVLEELGAPPPEKVRKAVKKHLRDQSQKVDVTVKDKAKKTREAFVQGQARAANRAAMPFGADRGQEEAEKGQERKSEMTATDKLSKSMTEAKKKSAKKELASKRAAAKKKAVIVQQVESDAGSLAADTEQKEGQREGDECDPVDVLLGNDSIPDDYDILRVHTKPKKRVRLMSEPMEFIVYDVSPDSSSLSSSSSSQDEEEEEEEEELLADESDDGDDEHAMVRVVMIVLVVDDDDGQWTMTVMVVMMV
nr:hypothetical protein BaRGS_013922 [Batillaria attramentaria]